MRRGAGAGLEREGEDTRDNDSVASFAAAAADERYGMDTVDDEYMLGEWDILRIRVAVVRPLGC